MKIRSLLTTMLLCTSLSPAAAKTLKVAALVPEGTSWAKNLKSMAKEVKQATQKRVKIKLYLGGVAGDEPDVMRKIRAGQLHGGVFTGKALGEVYGDVRLLELPFNFKDRPHAQKVLTAMTPHLNAGLSKSGFHNLGFFELGNVYIVSKKKAAGLDQLKGIKIWAWEGDELVEAIMKNLNLAPTSLPLPDVLTSLQTGMIESAYATPLAIIALQWQSKVKYLIDFPVTYSFGGLLLSQKAWNKISAADKKTLNQIAAKWILKTNDTTIAENKTSLQALKSMGIEFLKFPDTDIPKGHTIRKQVLDQLTGKLYSPQGKKLLLDQLSK